MSPDIPSPAWEQLAFDIEGMIREAQVEAAPPWTGARLHFSTDHYPAAELDAVFEHWQLLHGGFNSYAASHMWHRAIAVPATPRVEGVGDVGASGEHAFDFFTADLRCLADSHRHVGCACVGDLIYQSICESCDWHSIEANENTAVEHWHDHACPGWRELPIVPARIKVTDSSRRLTKQAREWIAEHYPIAAQRPGAPIITERNTGTRHVPGRSPWNGYDMSHTAVASDQEIGAPKPAWSARPTLPRASTPPAHPVPQRPPEAIGIGIGIGS